MLQSELNANWVAAILAWCDSQISGRLYNKDANGIGAWSLDGSDNIQIDSWEPTDIDQPLISDLLAMDLGDVLSYYDNAYLNPYAICLAGTHAHLTTTQIGDITAAALPGLEGCVVYDSSAHCLKYHNGTTWVSL